MEKKETLITMPQSTAKSKLPVARCGTPYPVDSVTRPNHAKYALFFWSMVVFATSREAIEKYQGKLSYHEQEDARIEYYG